ncbi:MAG: hypothetical protein JRN20_07400 [Nitrososphaerota archaeon]|nr:hypothetical protein [Nitrososphaerota archaeon]
MKDGKNLSNDVPILYRKADGIHDEVACKVLATISSMLNEIALIKQEYKLETRDESMRKDSQSRCRLGEIWVTLEDLRPEKLDGYGKLGNVDKDSLREHMETLLNMVAQAREDL